MSTVFITTQGAYLRKRGGRFVVCKKDKELASIPQVAVDCIMLMGNVQVSTQAISELLKSGISLLYLSRTGKFKGLLQPGFPKNCFARMAQYESTLESEYALETALGNSQGDRRM